MAQNSSYTMFSLHSKHFVKAITVILTEEPFLRDTLFSSMEAGLVWSKAHGWRDGQTGDFLAVGFLSLPDPKFSLKHNISWLLDHGTSSDPCFVLGSIHNVLNERFRGLSADQRELGGRGKRGIRHHVPRRSSAASKNQPFKWMNQAMNINIFLSNQLKCSSHKYWFHFDRRSSLHFG